MTHKIEKKSSTQKTKATRPTKATTSIKTSRKTIIASRSKKQTQIKGIRAAHKVAMMKVPKKHSRNPEILLNDDLFPKIKGRKKIKF